MVAAIEARGLRKRYGRVEALAGLDLEVPAGSFFGLIGQNGAGKTTFIKLMLGIAWPSAGELRVLGAPAGDRHARRSIGYLPENLQPSPARTALGLMHGVGRIKGLTAAERQAAIPGLLDRVGLARDAWTRRAGGYSKGMRQRLGLAMALLGEPALLVLDEPTDGIDPLGRARIRAVLEEEAARGATIFLNSHLLAETQRICDRVAILAGGRLVLTDEVARLRADHRAFVRLGGAVDAVHAAAHAAGLRADEQGAGWFLDDATDAALQALHRAVAEQGAYLRELRPMQRDLEAVLAHATDEARGQAAPAGQP